MTIVWDRQTLDSVCSSEYLSSKRATKGTKNATEHRKPPFFPLATPF